MRTLGESAQLTGDGSATGDTWRVTGVLPDGALTVREASSGADRNKPREVLLDAHYVAEHVQLGYAVTAHRAQGATVDTCHVIVVPGMTREAFYVAMTRGRHANTTYVIAQHTDPEVEGHLQDSGEPPSPQQVLGDVLATEGTERSATEQLQQQTLQATANPARLPPHDPLQGRRGRPPMPVTPGAMGVER